MIRAATEAPHLDCVHQPRGGAKQTFMTDANLADVVTVEFNFYTNGGFELG